MKKYTILLAFAVLFMAVSCEYFNFGDTDGDDELTTAEIIEGLKKALEIGTDSSALKLSALNGYYLDALVRIPLPDEAVSIRNKINGNNTLATISELVGLEEAFENVVLYVNRAAEDAANEAGPIFKGVINSLTIEQGWDILNGVVPGDNTKASEFDSTAATQFFKLRTYDALTDLYAPKIDVSLSKDIVGNVSAYDAWNTVTTKYNNFIGRTDVIAAIQMFGQDLNLPDAIETDIGVFSTQKALNGLFFKVGEQEKKIRKNPFEWALNIIQKVFGYIQEHWNEYTGGE